MTQIYSVKVVVEYDYEVEAESKEEAEQEGWNYEEYKGYSSVYSIKTELLDEECEECGFYKSDADGIPLENCESCGRKLEEAGA
jgi:hypothetical protein